MVQYSAVIMIVCGMFGKFGALFVTVPEPVVAGVFVVMFAMITAVGVSTLQYVDLGSARNLFVFGISVFLGLGVPKVCWKKRLVTGKGRDRFYCARKVVSRLYIGIFYLL